MLRLVDCRIAATSGHVAWAATKAAADGTGWLAGWLTLCTQCGGGGGGTGTGLERASATALLAPGTWRRSVVNSAMYAKWRCCLAVHGGEILCRAVSSGLWSVCSWNDRPSREKRKWRMAL